MVKGPVVVPSAEDDRLLQEAFAAAAEEIGNMVTRALQSGVPMARLAVVVERALSGKTTAICSTRHQFSSHVAGLERLDTHSRETIAKALMEAGPDELPVIVLAQREQYGACGVRRERGQLVDEPPPPTGKDKPS